jgi:hypothetical protein
MSTLVRSNKVKECFLVFHTGLNLVGMIHEFYFLHMLECHLHMLELSLQTKLYSTLIGEVLDLAFLSKEYLSRYLNQSRDFTIVGMCVLWFWRQPT